MPDIHANATAPGPALAPAPAGAKLTEAPTPAKSLLADADDTECIPDTHDEGSASKAMRAAMHSTAMPDAAPSNTAAAAAATAADVQASLSGVSLPLPPAQASRQVAAAATRMVPESPDEEAPLRALSQHGPASQPQSCTPALLQEPVSATEHAEEQQLSGPQAPSLHLSLDLLSSETAGNQPPTRPLPLSDAQQSAAVGSQASTAVDTGIRHIPGALADVTVVPTGTAAEAHMENSSSAAVGDGMQAQLLADSHARAADTHAANRPVANSRQGDQSAGFQATSAAAGVMTHPEVVAEAADAAEAAETPAGKRAVHAGSSGPSTASPMNDSALMAALDSAERKIMQASDFLLEFSVYRAFGEMMHSCS